MLELFIGILSSIPCLFVSSVVFTVAGISFVRKFVDNIKPNFWYRIWFGCLNGTIAIVAELLTTSNAPYIIMVFVPIVMILEIMSISKNPPWIYVFVLGSFILNVSVIYNLVVAVLGISSPTISYALSSLDYRVLIFSLTLIVCTMIEVLFIKFIPTRELNYIVYRIDRSIMLVVYIYIVSITLLIVSITSAPVIYIVSAEQSLLRTIYFEMILKDSIMLVGSYVILLFCCRDARNEFITSSLKKDLHLEKEFRNITQNKALCSYSYNATKERLEDLHPIFSQYSSNPCAENYYTMIQHHIEKLVHPEDKERVLSELINVDITQKAEQKLLSCQFRINRENLFSLLKKVEGFDLPQESLDEQKEWIWVEARDTCTTDSDSGDIIVYVDLFNVEDKVQEKEKLVTAATLDALTGLYNRATAESRIRETLMETKKVGAFFMIDMDNFKLVNDTFGHPEGDKLLQKVATEIKAVFRSADIVARLGGDEFCVFAPGMISPETAQRCVELLLNRCKFSYALEEGSFEVTPSIGIVLSSKTDNSYEQLYEYADIALYQAKEAGKNCWRMYEPS